MALAYFPGFDGIRLFAALAVLFSHAFPIAEGSHTLAPASERLASVGIYGVYTFFVISGFLLSQSLALNPRIVPFTVNRVLRLYPGFVLYASVAALVIGPVVTTYPPGPYLAHDQVWAYLTTSLLCLCDVTLPGVFTYPDTASLAPIVNGSLWSLSFELLSYVVLVWAWVINRSPRVMAGLLASLAVLTYTLPVVNHRLAGVAYTLPFFAGGVVMYAIHRRFGTSAPIAFGCVGVLIAAAAYGMAAVVFPVAGAYLIVFLGKRPNIGSRFAERFGDLSYGVYLYGWPAEQLVKQLTGTTSSVVMLTLAAPLALLAALVSFHLVERPVLAFKRVLGRHLEELVTSCGMRGNRPGCTTATSVCVAITVPFVLTSESHWWFVTLVILELSALAAVIFITCALAVRSRGGMR